MRSFCHHLQSEHVEEMFIIVSKWEVGSIWQWGVADEEKIGRVMTDPIVSWGSHPSSVYFYYCYYSYSRSLQESLQIFIIRVSLLFPWSHHNTCSCRCFQTTLQQQRRDVIATMISIIPQHIYKIYQHFTYYIASTSTLLVLFTQQPSHPHRAHSFHYHHHHHHWQ